MFQKLSLTAALALSLLLPSRILAGGPPWLCLPVDGVTHESATACTALIEARLKDKLWTHPEVRSGAEIHYDGNQAYLTFYMKDDVSLGDIEAALKGSEFSIPRDKIRLFGHVILDIDLEESPSKELAAALDGMDHVAIAESDENNGKLRLTVEMPYPVVDNRPQPENLRWEKFAKNDYNSVDAKKTEPSIGPEKLPGYHAFRDVLARHGASLHDVRWNTDYACRALGCVSVPETKAVLATATDLSSPKKN
jgi:hypothetical protein